MIECSACGAELKNHETRCPFCGKPTAHYHRQRRCLHCGTPAAEKAETCLMCGQVVDSLPLRSLFGGTWLGLALGVVIIVGLVVGVNNYQPLYENPVQADEPTSTPTATVPQVTPTPTATATATPPPPTVEILPTPTPRTHTIESGQSLYYIAQQYEVSVEELEALNNITDERSLQVGQVLIVPANSIGGDNQSSERPPQIIHTILAGQTLSGLAYEFDTSIAAIVAANPDVNLDLIYEGQEIVIPLAMPTATPTATSSPTATFTPTPPYSVPNLLAPVADEVVSGSVVLFNWTATGWLDVDEFYVLQLIWPDNLTQEYWTKGSSQRVTVEERPVAGTVSWTVTIKRQTGTDPNGMPVGESLTGPAEVRLLGWNTEFAPKPE